MRTRKRDNTRHSLNNTDIPVGFAEMLQPLNLQANMLIRKNLTFSLTHIVRIKDFTLRVSQLPKK